MDEKRINPLTIVFIIAQLSFFIILAFVFHQISTAPYIKDAQGNYVNQPEVEIAGLDKGLLNLTDEDIKYIQRQMFKMAQYNTPEISKNIKGEVRKDSIKNIYFEEQDFRYLRAILDLPELEQSYEFFYGYPSLGDDSYHIGINDTIFILCLDTQEDIIYPNFKCDNYSYAPERTELGAEFLHNFYFDRFSIDIEPANFSRIIISPVLSDSDDVMKEQYISEVKSALESLGISPDIFTYYIWSLADVDFNN